MGKPSAGDQLGQEEEEEPFNHTPPGEADGLPTTAKQEVSQSLGFPEGHSWQTLLFPPPHLACPVPTLKRGPLGDPPCRSDVSKFLDESCLLVSPVTKSGWLASQEH